MPIGHLMHSTLPCDNALYLPSGQSMHSAARGDDAYLPAMQGEQMVAPLALKLPAEQSWHSPSVLTLPCVPAEQLKQLVVPSTDVVPSVQLLHAVWAVCEVKRPTGQLWHVEPRRYETAAHARHFCAPTPPDSSPTPHGLHDVAPATSE